MHAIYDANIVMEVISILFLIYWIKKKNSFCVILGFSIPYIIFVYLIIINICNRTPYF